jgi:hypothetical protein
VHNGTISALGDNRGVGKSDTRVLSELIYDSDVMSLTMMKPLVEQLIGYNKVAVMTDGGSFLIFNEDRWTKDDGVWYSNDGYKEYSTYHSSKYTSSYSNSNWSNNNRQYGASTPTANSTTPTPPPYHSAINAAIARQFGEFDDETDDATIASYAALFGKGRSLTQPQQTQQPGYFDLRKFHERFVGNSWQQWGFMYTHDGILIFDRDEDFRDYAEAIKRSAIVTWNEDVRSVPPSFSYYVDRQIMTSITADILDKLYELNDKNPEFATKALEAMKANGAMPDLTNTDESDAGESGAAPATPVVPEATTLSTQQEIAA